MNRDVIATAGVGISVVFFFFRYAVATMPKSVAWAGVASGLLIVLADMVGMRLTLPAIALFLVGTLCIVWAVHLSLQPKLSSGGVAAEKPALSSANNQSGDIRENKGIITQGQSGDNTLKK